jgi:hypothetical protein
MSYLGVLMHDIRFAFALAAREWASGQNVGKPVEFWSPVLWRQVSYDVPPLRPLNDPLIPPTYQCYPSENGALDFLRECAAQPERMIAYDIETPYGDAKETDEPDADAPPDAILSIQFSLAPETGIFFPWREPFIDIARRILALPNPKIGANCWRFDQPRLAANGVGIAGPHHDLRWGWKHFQPDLSASLQFVTSFYAPGLAPWKHLAKSHPQPYGIRDVDALQRCI